MKTAALLIAAILVLSSVPLSARASTQTSFEAIHFPTVMTFAGFSDPTMDAPFVAMLKESGVTVVVIEQDPVTFMANQGRYSSLIALIHSEGLKVHLINQMDYKSRLALLGEKNPLQTLIPPSKAKILNYETQWIQLYASYHPDYLTVLAEPSNLNIKMRVGLIDSDWNAIISSLVQTAKSISPDTQTWIDLVPSPSIVDYYIGTSAIGIKGLDGIGWDVYNGSLAWDQREMALQEQVGGKLVGATETWWRPLVTEPQYGSPIYAVNESAWFSRLYNATVGQGITPSLFDPFFTSRFVTMAQESGLTASGMREYSATLEVALLAGNRTVDFLLYQQLIAAS